MGLQFVSTCNEQQRTITQHQQMHPHLWELQNNILSGVINEIIFASSSPPIHLSWMKTSSSINIKSANYFKIRGTKTSIKTAKIKIFQTFIRSNVNLPLITVSQYLKDIWNLIRKIIFFNILDYVKIQRICFSLPRRFIWHYH